MVYKTELVHRSGRCGVLGGGGDYVTVIPEHRSVVSKILSVTYKVYRVHRNVIQYNNVYFDMDRNSFY